MRPETVLILSGIDATTLAKFPRELDPCVNETLRDPEVLNALFTDHKLMSRGDFVNMVSKAVVREYPEIATSTPDIHSPQIVFIAEKIAPASVITADDIRHTNIDVREEVARIIQTVTVPEAIRITTPTVVPGVVTPNPETGLPPVPFVFSPGVMRVPDVTSKGVCTIELQEIIPGIKPPAIPLLLPGLEKLPLLPGWTIRDQVGKVVNKGADLPTLPQGMMGIPIPPEMPRERVPTGDVLRMLEPVPKKVVDDGDDEPREALSRTETDEDVTEDIEI